MTERTLTSSSITPPIQATVLYSFVILSYKCFNDHFAVLGILLNSNLSFRYSLVIVIIYPWLNILSFLGIYC